MLLMLVMSCAQKAQDDTVSVIPEPMYMRIDEGVFNINKDTKLVVDYTSEEMLRIAGFLNEKLSKAAGFELELIPDGPMPKENVIAFMDAGMPTEQYVINVNPNMILVDYGDGAGAFYALQTLFQLLPTEIYSQERQKGIKWNVPCCNIEDKPRFKYRGMHLDVCLHYFDFEFLKKYIDIMAAHKVNRFHWHLTEDQGWRLEIKKYPLLTEKGQWRKETVVGSLKSGVYDGTPHGGYYTQATLSQPSLATLSFHAVLRIIMRQRPSGEYSSRFTVLRNLHSSSLRTYSMRYSSSSLQSLSISVVTSVQRQAGRLVLIASP